MEPNTVQKIQLNTLRNTVQVTWKYHILFTYLHSCIDITHFPVSISLHFILHSPLPLLSSRNLHKHTFLSHASLTLWINKLGGSPVRTWRLLKPLGVTRWAHKEIPLTGLISCQSIYISDLLSGTIPFVTYIYIYDILLVIFSLSFRTYIYLTWKSSQNKYVIASDTVKSTYLKLAPLQVNTLHLSFNQKWVKPDNKINE